MDGRFARGKAFNLSLLATALAEQGQIEHACAIGSEALALAAGLHSARIVRYIRDLQRVLHRRADNAAVHSFSADVTRVLPAGASRAGWR